MLADAADVLPGAWPRAHMRWLRRVPALCSCRVPMMMMMMLLLLLLLEGHAIDGRRGGGVVLPHLREGRLARDLWWRHARLRGLALGRCRVVVFVIGVVFVTEVRRGLAFIRWAVLPVTNSTLAKTELK